MNREILFRGWRVDGGGWVEGCLLRGMYIIPAESEFDVDIGWKGTSSTLEHVAAYEVDPATVGQFTGLTDKDGKRIFEEDVLRVVGVRPADDPPKPFTVIVKFNTYFGWSVGTRPDRFGTRSPHDELYVIGNVHDNPELLGANL